MEITAIREALRDIVSGQVLWDREILRYYSVDASHYQVIPEIVVIPKNEKDIVTTIRFAKKIRMAVTARGGGTGLVGSALNRGIILDLRNLRSIRVSGNSAVVGAGAFKGMLDQKLGEKKKIFAPNPSVGAYCSVGGMLGNNSSGSKSLKYGSVIDNVTEITFVDGNGEKITLPADKNTGEKILGLSNEIQIGRFPATTKNSSGYRLDSVRSIKEIHKAIIGSEGTLGVILSAKIKIRDAPKRHTLFVVECQAFEDAARMCVDVLQTQPDAVEFVDRATLQQIPEKFNKKTKCLLFIEYDFDLKGKKEQLEKIVSGNAIMQITKKSDIQRWWRYRDSSLYYSLKSIKTKENIPHVIEDAAVPVERLGELFCIIAEVNHKYKVRTIMYGHAGNGNIHVRLDPCGKRIKIKDISKYYFERVNRLGGTITGEHGDGIARTGFVRSQYGPKNYLVFKRLKRLFDPENIMNPDKIISSKSMQAHAGKS